MGGRERTSGPGGWNRHGRRGGGIWKYLGSAAIVGIGLALATAVLDLGQQLGAPAAVRAVLGALVAALGVVAAVVNARHAAEERVTEHRRRAQAVLALPLEKGTGLPPLARDVDPYMVGSTARSRPPTRARGSTSRVASRPAWPTTWPSAASCC